MLRQIFQILIQERVMDLIKMHYVVGVKSPRVLTNDNGSMHYENKQRRDGMPRREAQQRGHPKAVFW